MTRITIPSKRLVAALVAAFCMAVCTHAADKNGLVTLTLTDEPLPQALKMIERQGGKSILFTYKETERYRVTMNIKGKTEAEAIAAVLRGKPFSFIERSGYFVVQYSRKSAAGGGVRGRVTDTEGRPMGFANVIMLRGRDSSYVAGCVTEADGTFAFPSMPSAPCLLKVSFVGCKTAFTPCRSVNYIRLEGDTRLLKGVTVTNGRPMIEHRGGTLVANVAGTPLALTGSADELLSNLPMVTGEEGSYEVIGRGAAEVYINSRKVRDATELKQLQADEVLSAEILMNPGARYSSETGAVIRLKTKRKSGQGLSGQAMANWSQGRNGRGNEGLSLNYRTGGLDIFVRGHFFENNDYSSSTTNTTMWTSSTWRTAIHNSGTDRNANFRGEVGFNYEPDARQSFGVRYVPGKLLGTARSKRNGNTVVSRDGELVEELNSLSTMEMTAGWSHSVNAYYNATFGLWGIDFNADYYGSDNHTGQDVMYDGVTDASSVNDVKNKLYAVKLVLSRQTGKGQLAVGTEETFTDRRDRFTQSGFSADADDHLRQSYYSAFADYSVALGRFSLTVGLRYEHQRTQYYEAGVFNGGQSPTYNDLLPSASVDYQHGDFSLSLAYRLMKLSPSYRMLSSATSYSSKYLYANGDPNLVPQKHNYVSLLGGWRWVTLSLWFDYTQNMYTTYYKPYDDAAHPGVMLQTMASIPHTRQYGAVLSLTPKIGLWQPNFQADIDWYDADARCLGITKHWNEPRLTLSLNNFFTFNHGWMLRLYGTYQFYSRSSYAIKRPVGYVDLRVVKTFFKDKSLKLALNVKDAFNTRYYPFTGYGDRTYSSSDNHRDYRRVELNLTYTFNATKSKYRGRGAGQSEKQRL